MVETVGQYLRGWWRAAGEIASVAILLFMAGALAVGIPIRIICGLLGFEAWPWNGYVVGAGALALAWYVVRYAKRSRF